MRSQTSWRSECHQSATDVDAEVVCGDPLLAPLYTSARVQSRFEFVELGGDMYQNYHGKDSTVTGMTGWYHLVPRTIYESTVYIYVGECRVCTGT